MSNHAVPWSSLMDRFRVVKLSVDFTQPKVEKILLKLFFLFSRNYQLHWLGFVIKKFVLDRPVSGPSYECFTRCECNGKLASLQLFTIMC